MPRSSNIVMAEPFMIKVCEAMGLPPGRVHRVVIDGKAGNALKVYVEMFGGQEMLDLEFPKNGVQINVVNRPVDSTAKNTV